MVCSVCHEELLLPRLLDCLHTYCSSCIDSLLEEGRVQCPQCGESTDCKDAKSLPLDPEYNHTANSTMLPRVCVVCGMLAGATCRVCIEDYCEKHVAAHAKMRATKEHVLSVLPSVNNGTQCTVHMVCNLEYYCVTCRCLICLECAVTKHEPHERTTLVRAVKDLRDVMDDRKSEFEREIETIKQHISELATRDKKQADSLYYIQQEIRYARGNIESLLQAREEELMEKVKQCSATNTAVIQHKQADLEARVQQLSHCVASSETILSNTSPLTVLLMEPLLNKRVLTLANRKPDSTAAVEQRIVSFKPANKELLLEAISLFGTITEKTQLKTIGKLKARWEVRNSKFAPRGLAVTKAGNVLVVDSGNRCVVEFTVGGSYIKKVKESSISSANLQNVAVGDIGIVVTDSFMFHLLAKTVSSFGAEGVYPGQFKAVSGAAISSAGNILISDSVLNRVSMLSPQGEFILCFGTGKPGAVHTLNKPLGISVDQKDNVYVADSGNCRVAVFNHKGCYLHSIGAAGSGAGKFSTPTDVSISSEGLVAVTDTGSHCVQLFKPCSSHFGVVQLEQFSPSNVAWAPSNTLVLSDSVSKRVVVVTV